jgi:hypothetical protein
MHEEVLARIQIFTKHSCLLPRVLIAWHQKHLKRGQTATAKSAKN